MSATLQIPAAVRAKAPALGGRVLAVVSHTGPRYGGLSTAVPRLGRSVTQCSSFAVDLAAFCAPGEHTIPEGYTAESLSFWPVSRRAWTAWGGTGAALQQRFAAHVRQVDALHLHGLWEASTAVGRRAGRRCGKPYVLSAHGMLEPWALANKRLKKAVYAALMERHTVKAAACLHALTATEASQYRSFGARGPIAVVPNAVELPESLSSQTFLDRFPHLEGKRLVLFLSRLHPKKGLDLLAEAWASIAREFPDAHLVLAGPDSEGTEAKLRQRLQQNGTAATVTFTGMLQGPEKWSALAAAEAFVLPSFSEGLSMAALEAMGAGLPVVLTRGCNLPEAAEAGAGWEIDAAVMPLRDVFRVLLQRTPLENKNMGARGAALVQARYAPAAVAEQMAEVYRFAVYGTTPATVTLQ